MTNNSLTRRAFLAATTTAALVATTDMTLAFAEDATRMPKINTAKVIPRKLSPNEKLNIAAIGAGGKGKDDIMSCRSENIVALCDPDWENAAEMFYRLPDAKQYKDYRVMFDEMSDQIDAVTITTPDHTHAPAAYWAMMLGKHVRVQNPLTHTIAEARLLTETARKQGVVTAMGNQGHAKNEPRELCEMIWSGAIGQVTEAHAWTDRPIWPQGIAKRPEGQPVPEKLDWDLWLGTAPFREYNERYAPFRWRGWWDFGCGAIGDMACHIMDSIFWSLKLGEVTSYSVEVAQQKDMTEETYPRESVIKYEFPARGDMPPVTVYWHDGGLLPEWPETAEENTRPGKGSNGALYTGTDGWLTSGDHLEGLCLLPQARMKDYVKPEPTIERIPDENSYMHWINACKNGAQAVSHFDHAGPLTEMANMGNVALLAGEKIEFDVASMTITNNKDANKHLTKKYRKGFDFMPL